MSQYIEQPKTKGDCWDIYKRFGLLLPQLPLDESIFPNARILAGVLNTAFEIEKKAELMQAELTKEREDNRKAVGLLRKMDAILDFSIEVGANESMGEFEDPFLINLTFAEARNILEGNEPDEV